MSALYELLQVALDATQEELRLNYRRIALEYHPDRNPEPSAAEHFAKVASAYAVLSDPESRAEYDNKVAAQPQPLTEEDISKLRLHCVVCERELSEAKAKSRSRYTCSKACRDKWMAYQKLIRKNKRCHFCHAPSTPAERELYRDWRKHLGQIRKGPGKPVSDEVRGRQREFIEALKQAIGLLGTVTGKTVNAEFWSEGADAIERFQNLVDGKGWVRRTLPESGDAAAASKGDDDGISGGQAMGAGIGLSEHDESDSVEHSSPANGAAAGHAEPDGNVRDPGAERQRSDSAVELRDAPGHRTRANAS